MDKLKEAIFREARKQDIAYIDINDNDMNELFFVSHDSLRLSLTGFIVLKKIFTVYSFKLDISIRPRHRIALSKLEYPYYLTSSRLVLFSSMDAVMVKLCGGLTQFLESIYLS